VILDTNAVSALFAGDEDLDVTLQGEGRLHLPTVVLGEYRYGLLRSSHREHLGQLLDTLTAQCRVLPIDPETAQHYATVREALRRRGTPIPENDVWIAALARQHRLPVVSRDRHFDRVEELVRLGW
jgi:predicted nucleic acid-binding protein